MGDPLQSIILNRRRVLESVCAIIVATTDAMFDGGDAFPKHGSQTAEGGPDMDANGLVVLRSVFSVKDTLDRLEAALEAKNVPVLARIDHSKAAADVGLELRSTELLIFGSAKTGTPLMRANQAIGIDLPLKALAFADAEGNTSLLYNKPDWFARRHGLDTGHTSTLNAMSSLLESAAAHATGLGNDP